MRNGQSATRSMAVCLVATPSLLRQASMVGTAVAFTQRQGRHAIPNADADTQARRQTDRQTDRQPDTLTAG
eukprot:9608825-Alexandrium_andersonii.AAC.1